MLARIAVDLVCRLHLLHMHGQGRPDGAKEFIVIEGFAEIGNGAPPQDGLLGLGIFPSRDDDHPRAGREGRDLRLNIKTIHLSHPDIEDHDGNLVGPEVSEKILRFIEGAR